MISITQLREEDDQVLYLFHKDKIYPCQFMWMYKGNIEVVNPENNGQIISIPPRSWHKLYLIADLN